MNLNVQNRDQISNIIGLLAVASLTGVGFALGGTMGAQFMQGIGTNLTTTIIETGASKLKERLMSSGAHNHDIQKALSRASIKAIEDLEKECLKKSTTTADRKNTKNIFSKLKEELPNKLPTYLDKAGSNQNIINYLNGDLEDAAKQIWDDINLQDILISTDEYIKNYFIKNYFHKLLFFFVEDLKNDNVDSNKAWRAFQIMLGEGLQEELNSIKGDTSLIPENMQKLNEILTILNQPTYQRIPDGPFEKELNDLISGLRQDISIIDGKIIIIDKKITELGNEFVEIKKGLSAKDRYVENIQTRFLKLIDECVENRKNILIVGDVMLDCHINGSTADLYDSQQHKDEEVYTLEEYETTLGGAAHIARLFSEIANVTLIGAIGLDEEGNIFQDKCKAHNIVYRMLIMSEIETTTKIYIQRYTKRKEALIRFNKENIPSMNKCCKDNIGVILNNIDEAVKNLTYDCIIIKDNQKGMILKELVDHVSEIANKLNIPLYVDPKYDWEIFKEAKIESIFPNMKEAACGLYSTKQKSKIIATDNCCTLTRDQCQKLVDTYRSCCNNIVIKAGRKGSVIPSYIENIFAIETIKPLLADESDFKTDVGCGDVFDTFAIIGMLQGCSLDEAVLFANFIAGMHTKKTFLETLHLDTIKQELGEDYFNKYLLSNESFIKKRLDSN